MSKRYFINNLDTRIGRAILAELAKQTVEDPVHMCTMRNQNVQKPNGIRKILKKGKPKLSKKKMLEECDVYIYSLEETDISDIKFALSSLEKGAEQQKVLMLVSDVRVWSDSGKKKVLKVPQQENNQEGEDGEEDGAQKPNQQINAQQQKQPIAQATEKQIVQKSEQEGQSKANDQVQNEGNEDQQEKQQDDPYMYVAFGEQDYLQRKALTQYQYIKQTEDLILNFNRQNVKVIVICPGILYGQGQQIFYSLFKTAWLQQPKVLPYLGEGNNQLPTIHIADLAKFIIKIAQSPPEQKSYFNAFDLTKDRTQKSIIQSISRGVGSGLVQSVQNSNIISDPDTFRLNLHVLPSKQLIGTQEQPAQFQWTSKQGLFESIKNVLKQFCTHHNLRPIKIITYVSEQDRKQSNYDRIIEELRDEYRIPILRSQQILKYASQHLQGELKESLEEEYNAILDYLKESNPRQLDETLKVYYRVMKWRLSQNDCATRGFILDRQPRFQEQFKYVFLPIKPSKLKRKVKKVQPQKPVQSEQNLQQNQDKQENEENQNNNEENKEEEPQQQVAQQQEPEQENEDDEQKPKRQAFYPQSIIVLKNLDSHKHSKLDVVQYLSRNGVEELLYDSFGKSRLVVSESLRSYIERNGRPNNYLISKEQLVKEHQKYYRNLNNEIKDQKTEDQEKTKKIQDNQRARRQKIAEQVFAMIGNEGQFQIKKMPFRNYLMQFVVPPLNDSLLEVSNIIPNDPVELLAEYLYSKSYES